MDTINSNLIGGNELIFTNNNGIYSGGFSVNSIMMKAGMSPIMTLNTGELMGGSNLREGGSNKVSDLFENLVIPNWVASYNPPELHIGGGKKEENKNIYDDDNNDDEDIDDDLHDKLLDLVREKKIIQNKKKSRKNKISKNKSKKHRNK